MLFDERKKKEIDFFKSPLSISVPIGKEPFRDPRSNEEKGREIYFSSSSCKSEELPSYYLIVNSSITNNMQKITPVEIGKKGKDWDVPLCAVPECYPCFCPCCALGSARSYADGSPCCFNLIAVGICKCLSHLSRLWDLILAARG